MDIQMPVLEACEAATLRGCEAARAFRALAIRQGRRPVPLVSLPARSTKDSIQRGPDAGLRAHLARPIRRVELFRTGRIHGCPR